MVFLSHNLFDGVLELLVHPVFGLLAALLMGFLTSLSPCSIANISLAGSMVGSGAVDRKRAVVLSAFFCLGMSLVFMFFGITISFFGEFLASMDFYLHLVMAALLIFVGLHYLNIFGKHTHCAHTDENGETCDHCKHHAHTRTPIQAFAVGITGGVLDSPCVIPVLVTAAAVAASGAGVVTASLIVLLFCVGHCILPMAVCIGTAALGKAQRGVQSAGNVIRIVFAVVLFAVAALLIVVAFLE